MIGWNSSRASLHLAQVRAVQAGLRRQSRLQLEVLNSKLRPTESLQLVRNLERPQEKSGIKILPLGRRPLGENPDQKPEQRSNDRNRLTLMGFWSGKRDSNSRPQPWQGCALPTELFPRLAHVPEQTRNCRARSPGVKDNRGPTAHPGHRQCPSLSGPQAAYPHRDDVPRSSGHARRKYPTMDHSVSTTATAVRTIPMS